MLSLAHHTCLFISHMCSLIISAWDWIEKESKTHQESHQIERLSYPEVLVFASEQTRINKMLFHGLSYPQVSNDSLLVIELSHQQEILSEKQSGMEMALIKERSRSKKMLVINPRVIKQRNNSLVECLYHEAEEVFQILEI